MRLRGAALAVLGLIGCGGPSADLEARVQKLEAEVADLRSRVRSKSEEAEESVVGKDALLVTTEWLQGSAALDGSKATLFVFWELWCPHCKREIPQLQQTFTTYRDRGLNVVGITRLTRDTKPVELMRFLEENGVAYPMGVDDGTMTEHYAVSGVPAAALVKDGKIVWRGHPQRLNTSMIEATLR